MSSQSIFSNLSFRPFWPLSVHENSRQQEKRKIDSLKLFPAVIAEKQEMKSVKIPTYWVDIFNREKLAYAKILLSPNYLKNLEPGFSYVHLDFMLTLEGYMVDKHLSGPVKLGIVYEALGLFKNRLYNAQCSKDKETAYNVCCEISENDQYVHNHYAEIDFIGRVFKRLYIQEQAKLCKELPLPNLSPEHIARLKNTIQTMEATGEHLTEMGLQDHELSLQERSRYRAYLGRLFDERNRRMLTLLQRAYKKDAEVRSRNPKAPLTYLVTLESYENKIFQKRLHLLAKVAAVVACVFFFSRNVLRLI